MNAADWTDRHPRIIEAAACLKREAIIDAEVVCTDEEGRADFDRLQPVLRAGGCRVCLRLSEAGRH
jgi:ATP-dependent DNA ligase